MGKQWHGNDRKWTPWKEVQNPGSIYSTDIYIYKCISNHKITIIKEESQQETKPWRKYLSIFR